MTVYLSFLVNRNMEVWEEFHFHFEGSYFHIDGLACIDLGTEQWALYKASRSLVSLLVILPSPNYSFRFCFSFLLSIKLLTSLVCIRKYIQISIFKTVLTIHIEYISLLELQEVYFFSKYIQNNHSVRESMHWPMSTFGWNAVCYFKKNMMVVGLISVVLIRRCFSPKRLIILR